MAKKHKAEPIIEIKLDVEAIKPGGVYLVKGEELGERETVAFKLAWQKIIKESGNMAWALVIPKGTTVEEMDTMHLQVLRDRIDETLQKRGLREKVSEPIQVKDDYAIFTQFGELIGYNGSLPVKAGDTLSFTVSRRISGLPKYPEYTVTSVDHDSKSIYVVPKGAGDHEGQ